jgi:tetratricopeptide (TPR) repeat protein
MVEGLDWQHDGPLADLSEEQRAKTLSDLADLLFLASWGKYAEATLGAGQQEGARTKLEEALTLVRAAQRCYPDGQAPLSLGKHESALLARLDRPGVGEEPDSLELSDARTASDCFLDGGYYAARGQFWNAIKLLGRATYLEPRHFASWYLLGSCYANLDQYKEAASHFNTAISLRPDFGRAWYHRGLSRLYRGLFEDARADFDKAVELEPTWPDAWLSRALAWQRLNDKTKALADLNKVLELEPNCTQAWFLRAQLHREAGRLAEARDDEANGFSRTPASDHDRVVRGYQRARTDPQAALDDFNAVLRVNPRYQLAWRYKVIVLAENPGQLDQAIETLDKALKYFPDAVLFRVCRGVYHARCGHRERAHADAQACKTHGTPSFAALVDLCAAGGPVQPATPWGLAFRSGVVARLGGEPYDAGTVYRLACIYALTSPGHPEDRRESLYWLKRAVDKGFDRALIARDDDVAALRDLPEFRDLLNKAR